MLFISMLICFLIYDSGLWRESCKLWLYAILIDIIFAQNTILLQMQSIEARIHSRLILYMDEQIILFPDISIKVTRAVL